MFSTSVRGGKLFAAYQKVRELKTRIAKLASQKLKISLQKVTEISTTNMNIQPSKKYGLAPEEVEGKTLRSESLEQHTICIDYKKCISLIWNKIDTIRKNTIKNEKN